MNYSDDMSFHLITKNTFASNLLLQFVWSQVVDFDLVSNGPEVSDYKFGPMEEARP